MKAIGQRRTSKKTHRKPKAALAMKPIKHTGRGKRSSIQVSGTGPAMSPQALKMSGLP